MRRARTEVVKVNLRNLRLCGKMQPIERETGLGQFCQYATGKT